MSGILKWKVEKHRVSNTQQLRDVIMEEWKRIRGRPIIGLADYRRRY